jgi:hypothetical protein
MEEFEVAAGALLRRRRRQPPIVDQQEIHLRQRRQALAEAAIAMGDAQFLEQPRQTEVLD